MNYIFNPFALFEQIMAGVGRMLIRYWFITVPFIIIMCMVYKCNNYIESNKQRTQPVQQAQAFVYVNADALNMRNGASSQADVITILHRDDKVEIVGQSNNESWVKVRFGNYEGFVNLNYLRE